MLEKMSDFFENRLDGYDEHMLVNIESADEFYPFTAKCKGNGDRFIAGNVVCTILQKKKKFLCMLNCTRYQG